MKHRKKIGITKSGGKYVNFNDKNKQAMRFIVLQIIKEAKVPIPPDDAMEAIITMFDKGIMKFRHYGNDHMYPVIYDPIMDDYIPVTKRRDNEAS